MSLKQEKIEQIAKQIMMLSRNTLLVNFRFLDLPVSRLELKSLPLWAYACEGKTIVYNPENILFDYTNEKELPARNYLHMIFHCIYRHMFVSMTINREIWDIACDIAVENTINELDSSCVKTKRGELQAKEITELQKNINILTAEKIYRYLLDKEISQQKLQELHSLFSGDSHDVWYMTESQISVAMGTGSGDGENQGGNGSAEDGEGGAQSSEALEKEWKKISETVQINLETFSKKRGTQAGNLMQNLMAVNREKYDYARFLKKFSVMGERMKINDDEFDYIFYTYGLKLYKKVPLVEPLEYKEVKRIKEFVVTIDTSGSTNGELVQKFVTKTYNILKNEESFFQKVNIHIIQCDATIQEDVKITNDEEFEQYIKTMQIKGLGGTDFRPVFEFVDELVQNKEFTNLKGLIYFTDGWGTFPEKMPDYETAFVFLDDDYNNPDVPPWAIKLILQSDEI